MSRIIGTISVLATLAFAPNATAGQPVTQTLIPAPLPWYTCQATGSGTVCQGSNTESDDLTGVGVTCGTGAGAFEILVTGTTRDRATRYYNADGLLTRRVVHVKVFSAYWSSPFSDATVPFTQHSTVTTVLAVPGDFASATETNVGENIYRDEAGRIVFRSVGRFVTAPNGDIEFRSGVQNFLDYFVDGDTSVLEPLCAALGS